MICDRVDLWCLPKTTLSDVLMVLCSWSDTDRHAEAPPQTHIWSHLSCDLCDVKPCSIDMLKLCESLCDAASWWQAGCQVWNHLTMLQSTEQTVYMTMSVTLHGDTFVRVRYKLPRVYGLLTSTTSSQFITWFGVICEAHLWILYLQSEGLMVKVRDYMILTICS